MSVNVISEILKELKFDTVSFRDINDDWFEGIDSKDFPELAGRLEKLFLKLKEEENLKTELRAE